MQRRLLAFMFSFLARRPPPHTGSVHSPAYLPVHPDLECGRVLPQVRTNQYARAWLNEAEGSHLRSLRSRQDELLLTHMLVETTGAADPTPFVKLFHQDLFELKAFDAFV